jgi:hypothetical protein
VSRYAVVSVHYTIDLALSGAGNRTRDLPVLERAADHSTTGSVCCDGLETRPIERIVIVRSSRVILIIHETISAPTPDATAPALFIGYFTAERSQSLADRQ